MYKSIMLVIAVLASNANAATRIISWELSACSSYFVGEGLVYKGSIDAGKTASCSIDVKYVPKENFVARTDISYELIYFDIISGKSFERKKALTGKDWAVFNGGASKGVILGHFTDEYGINSASIDIPLTINRNSLIRYSSIGVTANLVFSDGTKKKIYERIPIVYP